MDANIRRANAKKAKYKKYLDKPIDDEPDSDGEISEDDIDVVKEEMLGSIIGEKYLVAKYIGKGTFSKVWTLYNFETKEFVAGKIFPDEHRDEYSNELIILRQYTSYEPESKLNITMKTNFVDTFNGDNINVITLPLYGKSVYKLHREIREDGNHLSLDSCKTVIKSLCESLAKLHELNVLHMDIKPDNILSHGSPNDADNNSIETLRKMIANNDYDNFIENRTQVEQNNVGLNEMNRNQKKKHKKKIKAKVLKLFKKDYLEKYTTIFGNEENEEGKLNSNEDKVVDLPELNYVLSDYSNSILEKEVQSDEYYQARANRPAENILAIGYNKHSDSWAIATTFWYLLTGEDIFEPDLEKYKGKIGRDRKQLALIERYIGKAPQGLRMDCTRSFELYDDQGELLKTKKVERKDIQEELKALRPDLTEAEVYQACAFMVECWKYDYKKRMTPKELLKCSYFNTIPEESEELVKS